MRYQDAPKTKKILFTSGKGGVGKSTLTASFAKILYARGARVLVVDFDIALRTLDLMLNIGDRVLYDWADVIYGRCEPSEAILHNAGGPDLLPAPLRGVTVTEAQIDDLLQDYEEDYDYILLDSPAGVGRGFEAAVCSADRAIIVSTPDKVCVRRAAVAADRLVDRGIPARLVINRFQKKTVENWKALNIDDVIDSTGRQLIGVVPEDAKLAQSVLNGAPLDQSGKGARAIARILDRMQGQEIPLKI